MGIRIIEGTWDGTRDGAVMTCSTSMWAFGPIFETAEDVEAFLLYAEARGVPDVRTLSDDELSDLHAAWVTGKDSSELAPLLQASVAMAKAARTHARRRGEGR